MLTRSTLERINARPRGRSLWPFMTIGVGAIVVAALLFLSNGLALAALLGGAACVWIAYRRGEAGQTTSLVYGLDAETGARFAAIQEACEALAGSERIWRVSEQRARASKPGAPTTDRRRVEVGCLDTPGISANVAIWGIDDGDLKVFFFPEGILLYQQERYRGVSYKSFEVALSSARFIEEEGVPEDAQVVGHTWRYTREDGSPDRRHAPNPWLPVVLYGLLGVTGSSGLDMRLQVSDREVAARFARAFGAAGSEKAREKSPGEETSGFEGQERASQLPEEVKKAEAAYKTLGVVAAASAREITAAYRNKARVYHPDRVANLAPEVREFADQKMKEINAAYAELKHRRSY